MKVILRLSKNLFYNISEDCDEQEEEESSNF